MAAQSSSIRDTVVDYITAVGLGAAVVGVTWGFYMALKLLFA